MADHSIKYQLNRLVRLIRLLLADYIVQFAMFVMPECEEKNRFRVYMLNFWSESFEKGDL